jgi:hypothetical protein
VAATKALCLTILSEKKFEPWPADPFLVREMVRKRGNLRVFESLHLAYFDGRVYEPNSGGFKIHRGYLRYPLRGEM